MSFSGGVYTLPGPALVTGEVVSATENNQFRNDVAGAFNLAFLRNGTSTATANLPMGGYKLTGLGAPTTNGDALSYGNAAVVTSLTSTALTATRVPYVGTGGLLQDASTFTFDGTTLTAGGFSGPHNGTVGATTPNTGAFTTLSASSTVSGTGFSNYLASPPAIGGTAAAAGSFTTLTTSSAVTVNGGTANGVAYLNGSKVLTTGSALTYNGSNLYLGSSGISTGASTVISLGASSYFKAGSTLGFTVNDSTDTYNYFRILDGSGTSVWYPGGTEGMRLTSTGLGIGTSSPTTKVEVYGGAAGTSTNLTVGNANTAFLFGVDTANNCQIRTAQAVPMLFYTGSSERMRIDSSGNLLVGTTTKKAQEKVSIDFSSNVGEGLVLGDSTIQNGTTFVAFYAGASRIGGIVANGTTNVSYNTSSDYRLKENVQPMQNALDVVAQLNPVTYTWKADGSDGQGFIAHELQAVVPDCVTGEKDAVDEEGNPVYQGIDTSFLVATLTAAIKELKAELDATKAEVATLKGV